jgi:hypothetical protein
MKKEFEMYDVVYCIKSIGKFIAGRSYYISGSGDLSWNCASNKTGYGFSVGVSGEHPLGYFTEKEMSEYFVDNFTTYIRDKKINQLLDLDKYN